MNLMDHPEMRIKARRQWRDYYRSVRVLRNIRQADMKRFLQFSHMWWRDFYSREDEHERHAIVRAGLRNKTPRLP